MRARKVKDSRFSSYSYNCYNY